MSRLPKVGGDQGQWGDILNDYLSVSHNTDGSLKNVTPDTVGLGNVKDLDQTNPSNITQDSSHRFVSDVEKNSWNNKQDSIGYSQNSLNAVLAENAARYWESDRTTPITSVLCAMGDSITYCIDQVAFNQQWLYLALSRTETVTQATFARPSDANWVNNKLVGGLTRIFNVGGGGGTTASMLTRFSQDVLSFMPCAVTIMGGTNDVNLGYNDTENNILAMSQMAINSGITPILCTIIPFNYGTTTQRNRIDAINSWIRSYGSENHLPVVDMFKAMESPVGSQTSPYLLADNIHPSATGNQKMAEAFADALFSLGLGNVKTGIAPFGPVSDFVVTQSGKMIDLVTGVYIPIANTLSVSARPAPYSGYSGTFDGTIAVAACAERWNKDTGSIVVVHDDAITNATRYQFDWNAAGGTSSFVRVNSGSGTYSNPAGWLYNGTTNYAQFGPTKGSPGEYVHSVTWASGVGLKCYLGTKAGTASAAVTPPSTMPQYGYIGSGPLNVSPHGTKIHRVVVYDRELSASEIQKLQSPLLMGRGL